jgi:uncharacterized membrane protein
MNGQNADACRETGARTRTVSELFALASTTGPDFLTALMWQPTVTRLQDGENEAAATATTTGTRKTTMTFSLAADATMYRLRPIVTTSCSARQQCVVS